MLQEHVLDHLSDYVLGLLPASTQQEIEQHAAMCAECRQALHSERQLTQTIQQTLSSVAMPSPVTLKRLRPAFPQTKTMWWMTPTWQTAWATLAMVVVLFAGIWGFQSSPTSAHQGLPAPSASAVVVTATQVPTMTMTATYVAKEMPAVSTPPLVATPIAALFSAP